MPQNQQAVAVNTKQRKPPKIYTKGQWQRLISEYEAGQISQHDFCQKHQVSISSFHKWRKLINEASENTLTDTNSFIEITQFPETLPQTDQEKTTAPPHSDWQVELDLGRGVVLRLRGL